MPRDRSSSRLLPLVPLVVLCVIVPSRPITAQDSCAGSQMSVSPCLAGEQHVSSGGIATFNVTNYAYTQDAYYVQPVCSGIVTSCTGRGFIYVDPYDTQPASVPYRVTQQSGTGTAGARISSEWVSYETIDVAQGIYGQPALAIDSAQTPVYGADQRMGRCAVNCFTAVASISTVPFFTLGQARNLTLAYDEERAHPMPFIYATVSPAQDGATVSRYSLSATLNGAPVTFTNGEQTLTFLSPGNLPVRLGGQVSLPGALDPKDLVVSVTAQYASSATTTLSYSSKLVVYDASGSWVARGWTIANINQLACDWSSTWHGCVVFGGDGSLEYFPGTFPTYGAAADHSTLSYNSTIGLYERTYLDGSRDQYAGSGLLVARIDAVGRTTSFTYSNGRLYQIIDPRRNEGASVPYIQLGYDAGGNLHTITEQGGPGPARTTTVTVDPATRNLTAVQDPDGVTQYVSYYGNGYLHALTDRRGGTTYLNSGSNIAQLGSVNAPSIPVDVGGGATTVQTPTTYFSPWQKIGVPQVPTASAPPYASLASDITATVQAPGNRFTQFAVNAWGAPATSIDPLNHWRYVLFTGRDPTRTIDTDGERDTTVYDSYDRPVMTQSAGDSATYYHYNAGSQVDSTWGANTVATGSHYNADNTLAWVRDASGVSMSYTYNADKEVVTATDNAGHQTAYGYDPVFGNPSSVTLPGGRTTTIIEDTHGRDSVVSAPTLAAVTTVYDVMNRPTQIIPAGRPATLLTYDALFRTDVQDANGNVNHTDYNALGMPTAHRDASGATETYRYDIAGRKTSWTNRRGTIMSYTYDEGGSAHVAYGREHRRYL